MTDVPPGRYRIVERKGRIIVTDTWADGGRPDTPVAPPAGNAIPSMPSPWAPRANGNVGLLWLRRRLVALICLGATDDAGRSILTTTVQFDEKGRAASCWTTPARHG